jgi:hypothetical protein
MFSAKLLFAIGTSSVLCCALTTAAQAQAQAQTTAGPNIIPPGFVITPFGYFHPSCVVHLAEGDELRPDQQLIRHANGATGRMPACIYPHYRADGEKVMTDERGVKDPNIVHSWIVYESVTTTSSYGGLHALWSVPPTPPSNDGQILYFFPGLEDTPDVVTILQPVLGWNADYPSEWGIASWNCCEKGTTYEATPQHASPGDTILGYMFDTCPAGTVTCSSWDVYTLDLQNGKSSELVKTSNFKQTFNWAFGGVLEIYNVKQCSDYPNQPNGDTGGSNALSFGELLLYNDKFQQITNPAWSFTKSVLNSATPQCGYGGSAPQQVILRF